MKKWILVTIGWLATLLGFLGAFLPLLPTVPFLLLALFCFSRSSPRFNVWLEQNRYLGPTVKRLKTKEGLTVAEKQKILIYSWISIVATIILLNDQLHAQLILSAILVIETFVIIRYKTYTGTETSSETSSGTTST